MTKLHNKHTQTTTWSGMVLVDKPSGLTSQQVVTRVKRLTATKKAGHTGTLDPLASGLLPVCLNEGTKFASYLLAQDKCYRATLQLGCVTDTGDLEGTVLHTYTDPLPDQETVESILPRFKGEQDQIPPRYAAIKYQGKKYYEYAREGIDIERPARKITIFSLTFITMDSPYVTIDVHCSSGTYIRSLAEDIGRALGCGATLSALRRTAIGAWKLDSALPLDALTPPIEHPAYVSCDTMLDYLPSCILLNEEVYALYQGRSLENRKEADGLYRLFRDIMQPKMFIGLGDIQAQQLVSRRLLALHDAQTPMSIPDDLPTSTLECAE